MAGQNTYGKRRDEWYRNRRPGEQTTSRGRYSNFASTLQEIVRGNNQEINMAKDRKARVAQQKLYRKMSRGKIRGKARATPYVLTSEMKGVEERERIEKDVMQQRECKEVREHLGTAQK